MNNALKLAVVWWLAATQFASADVPKEVAMQQFPDNKTHLGTAVAEEVQGLQEEIAWVKIVQWNTNATSELAGLSPYWGLEDMLGELEEVMKKAKKVKKEVNEVNEEVNEVRKELKEAKEANAREWDMKKIEEEYKRALAAAAAR